MSGELITRVPYEAKAISDAGVLSQGEFDNLAELSFPYIRHSEPLFGGDLSAPRSWQAHIRVFGDESTRLPQLYLLVTNRQEQGFVRYDVATLPGGDDLKLDHIKYRQVDIPLGDGAFLYEEHLGIVFAPKLLADHIGKPLRIQISRPDSGVRFIVEIPSHYVAGVLHRLNPDRFEIASSPIEDEREIAGEGETDYRWFKTSVLTGAVVAAVASYFIGVKGGLVVGGLALMVVSGYLTKHLRR
jgi:hypothetical protein